MAETVNYADKYSPQVAERFTRGAVSASIVNNDYDFVGVNAVNVYSIPIVELGNYTLTGSQRYGAPAELGNTVKTYTLSQDKAFTFTIDKRSQMDTIQ